MHHALSLASRSPPKPTNFRVGALLVHEPTDTILATGFTLELPGNTHAEQCCFVKYAERRIGRSIDDDDENDGGGRLPRGTVLYTTMEPCNKRSSGNVSCVDRILQMKAIAVAAAANNDNDGGYGDAGEELGIQKVYFGVGEPGTFVGENVGRRRLEEVGVQCVHVSGLEEEILRVATAGHVEKKET